MARFFVPPSQWSGGSAILDEAEGRHAVEVLRFKVGDEITLFDGAGRVASARLVHAGKRRVEAEVLRCETVEKPLGRTTLVQAVPKGKLFDWILEKAVELGVSRVVPLLTERTVVQLDPAERERKREKWQRGVVEACKQCGQNFMPEVSLPMLVSECLMESPPPVSFVASLQPGAVALRDLLPLRLLGDVSVWIGPEGDFTAREIESITEWGARPVSLGGLVLRAETAAIYCLSVIANSR